MFLAFWLIIVEIVGMLLFGRNDVARNPFVLNLSRRIRIVILSLEERVCSFPEASGRLGKALRWMSHDILHSVDIHG